MSATALSRLVQLIRSIEDGAMKLDVHLKEQNKPELSFDNDFPSLSPEMIGVRYSLLEAVDELFDLLLGPRKLVECEPPQHTVLLGIQAISRYKIAEYVGEQEEVEYSELATRCNLPEDDLRRLLRMAIAKHIFKEPRMGFVAHNAASRTFLHSPGLYDWTNVALNEIWQSAAHMLDAMDKWRGSEEPNECGFNLAKGIDKSFFESTRENPARGEAFANVMKYVQSQPDMGFSTSPLVDHFDWTSVKQVVDIGGGTGSTALELTERFDSLHCIVQDLPDVVSQGRKEGAKKSAPRVKFMEHNFFSEQPVKRADVYLLRWILHDWSDKKAVAILTNLIPALKRGANIVLQEFVVPEPGVLPWFHEKKIRSLDLAMKASFNSKERSVQDWKELFNRADSRFHVENIKLVPSSGLGTIHAVWHGD